MKQIIYSYITLIYFTDKVPPIASNTDILRYLECKYQHHNTKKPLYVTADKKTCHSNKNLFVVLSQTSQEFTFILMWHKSLNLAKVCQISKAITPPRRAVCADFKIVKQIHFEKLLLVARFLIHRHVYTAVKSISLHLIILKFISKCKFDDLYEFSSLLL